jgi:esterase/lipase superfamily enzyme
MSDYIISLRNSKRDNTFGNDAAEASFLLVGDKKENFSPSDAMPKTKWLDEVLKNEPKDILVFVHGYNEPKLDILERHRMIKAGLKKNDYAGEVISFDWPCGENVLMYLPDRHLAKKTSLHLVTDCLSILAVMQSNGCTARLHVLAHSTGAFVMREAFNDAEDTQATSIANWAVSQIMFIGGDVSANSMKPGDDGQAIYNHCIRFTNYHNPYDIVLSSSNVKRLGAENRVGRVGLPDDAPDKCVDVNCAEHYESIKQRSNSPTYSHSWYFDDDMFFQDMVYTMQGNIDRNYIPTRIPSDSKNRLILK